MKTVKIGMIGAGAIAETHLAGIRRHAYAEVIAIADPSQPRREALARRHRIPRTCDSADALLADPRIDAVTIAVPNALHAPVAMAALKAGKHVLLEKPFAPTLAEAEAIALAAHRSGRVFMVGMNQRYTPAAQVIRQAIRSGRLGHVYHAKTFWLRRTGIPKFGTWFCRKDAAGGGCCLDIGVHMLDLVLYLMGNFDVETVSAATYTQLGNRGLGEGDWGLSDAREHVFDVEDFATALLRLRGGASVTVDVSWALNQEQPERQDVNLFGTDGGASVYPQPRIFTRPAADGSYSTSEPSLRSLQDAPCRFTNWIDAILGVAPPLCTITQAIKVQATIEAIYQSARLGREVRLPSRSWEHASEVGEFDSAVMAMAQRSLERCTRPTGYFSGHSSPCLADEPRLPA